MAVTPLTPVKSVLLKVAVPVAVELVEKVNVGCEVNPFPALVIVKSVPN